MDLFLLLLLAFISLQSQSFMGFSIHQTRMSVPVLQALFLEVVSLPFFSPQ